MTQITQVKVSLPISANPTDDEIIVYVKTHRTSTGNAWNDAYLLCYLYYMRSWVNDVDFINYVTRSQDAKTNPGLGWDISLTQAKRYRDVYRYCHKFTPDQVDRVKLLGLSKIEIALPYLKEPANQGVIDLILDTCTNFPVGSLSRGLRNNEFIPMKPAVRTPKPESEREYEAGKKVLSILANAKGEMLLTAERQPFFVPRSNQLKPHEETELHETFRAIQKAHSLDYDTIMQNAVELLKDKYLSTEQKREVTNAMMKIAAE